MLLQQRILNSTTQSLEQVLSRSQFFIQKPDIPTRFSRCTRHRAEDRSRI
jgi:hypothetical protein